MFRGFVDSVRGMVVLFYMDKEMNERANLKLTTNRSPANMPHNKSSHKSSNQQEYVIKTKLSHDYICYQQII